MMNFEAASLAYVRHVMAAMGLKATALAQKCGISSTTLTRALNDPNHKFTLSMKTLERIATTSGISPAPFLNATSSIEIANLEFHNDALHSDPKPTEIWPQDVIYIAGEIAAGKWREIGPFAPLGQHEPILLTYPFYAPENVFGLVVADNSANQIAQKGDRLICVRPKAVEEFEVPCPVVVERRSDKDFKIELTVRKLVRARGATRTLLALNKGKPAFPPLKYSTTGWSNDPDLGFRIVGMVDYVIRRTRSF